MKNDIDLSKPEGAAKLAKAVRGEFCKELAAVGGTSIPYAGNLMPRETWSRCIALALVNAGVVEAESADGIFIALNSDLGNSSQLGAKLLEEGVIQRQGVQAAAGSLASLLAKRAEAAKPPQA